MNISIAESINQMHRAFFNGGIKLHLDKSFLFSKLIASAFPFLNTYHDVSGWKRLIKVGCQWILFYLW